VARLNPPDDPKEKIKTNKTGDYSQSNFCESTKPTERLDTGTPQMGNDTPTQMSRL
jgi:hypothetical protein